MQVEWLLVRVRGGPLRQTVLTLVYRGTDELGDWRVNLDPRRERVFGAWCFMCVDGLRGVLVCCVCGGCAFAVFL